MERDVKFSFEDILGSPDLLDSDIMRYGAALMATDSSTNTSANLRFLRIPELCPNGTTSNITCTITDNGQYRDVVDYVAVSYCWNSFAQTNIPLSDPTRTISIIDRGISRNPRCPAEVIWRAVNFALARGISLVWIDQECIDQEDDADVQKHLQCMHTIYKQAKFAIGLLNFELKSYNQFMSVINFANIAAYPRKGFNEVQSQPEFLLNVKSIKFMTRLLNSVRMDPWFSRTWVFQERYSADFNMHFLFQISSKVRAHLEILNHTGPYWEDVALLAGDIGSIPAIWPLILENTSTETVELNVALEALKAATQSVCTSFEGISIRMIINTLVTGQNPHARQRPSDGFHLKSIFHHIENCDNQIVSDRVAIFANVAELDWRLNTTGLSSYSLSLLMLLHINNFLPRVLIWNSDETNFRSPFMTDVENLHLAAELFYFKGLIRDGHEGLDEELKAIDRILADILPLEARQCESTDALLADFGEGRPNALLPPLDSLVENTKFATIIPMSATIEELFIGNISDTSTKRADLSHSHGSKMVCYAVENGQLPEGSTFLAFCGGYVWRPDFIDEHFVAT